MNTQDERFTSSEMSKITGVKGGTVRVWNNRNQLELCEKRDDHKHRRYSLNDLFVISTMGEITAHTNAELTDVYKLAKQAIRTKGTKLFLYVRDGKWCMSAAIPHTGSYTCLNIHEIKENIKRNIENEYAG